MIGEFVKIMVGKFNTVLNIMFLLPVAKLLVLTKTKSLHDVLITNFVYLIFA